MLTARCSILSGPFGCLTLLLISGGCGKPYDRVSYDRPRGGPRVAVTFPAAEPREDANQLQSVAIENIEPGSQLEITGTVAFPSPSKWEPVIIDIFAVSGNGTHISANTGVGLPQQQDGEWRYQVTVQSPMKPGRYFAHARCGSEFVGRAEITVRTIR